MSENTRAEFGATNSENSSASVLPIEIQSIENSVPNSISVNSASPLTRIIAAESSPEEKSLLSGSETNLQEKKKSQQSSPFLCGHTLSLRSHTLLACAPPRLSFE